MGIAFRHYFFCFLLVYISQQSLGQQNNVWIFGDHAGIDFNSGTAVAFHNPVIDILEGTAVACDMSGNVLFYSDGIKVWDRNDQVMPNGTSLGGNSSSTSVFILQKPGDCSKYYVFTTEDHTQNGDLFYSVVDMCLNSGYGDVVPGEKKIFLHTNMSEKLCVVPHTNGTDAWLICHELSNNQYHTYSITSSGINIAPSIYSVGSSFASDSQSGYMKASPSGTMLAVGVFWNNICEVVNFDPSTGEVSTPAINYGPSMTSSSNSIWYGFEFSPNEQYLYTTRAGFGGGLAYLYQVDLLSGTTTLLSSAPPPLNYYYGALRLAPDGKIYMARSSTNYLGVIHAPDSAGLSCNYIDQGFQLHSNSISNLGLPLQMVSMPFNNSSIALGNDTAACEPFTINLHPTCDMTFLWQDGSTDSFYTISSSGIYWVTATNQCGTASDTINVVSGIQGSVIGDTIICYGQSATLSASLADSYLWSTGSGAQDIMVLPTQTTEYWVIVTSGMCSDTVYTTVEVTYPQKVSFILPADTFCIDASPFLLTGGNPSGGIYYGAGVSNNYFYPAIAGIGTAIVYYSYTDANGCSDTALQEIVVELCSGVTEDNSYGRLIVSPTITSDLVVITSGNNFMDLDKITLIDALGNPIFTFSLYKISSHTISLKDLHSGVYYLCFQGKEIRVVKVFRN